jgi:hypothetical protein
LAITWAKLFHSPADASVKRLRVLEIGVLRLGSIRKKWQRHKPLPYVKLDHTQRHIYLHSSATADRHKSEEDKVAWTRLSQLLVENANSQKVSTDGAAHIEAYEVLDIAQSQRLHMRGVSCAMLSDLTHSAYNSIHLLLDTHGSIAGFSIVQNTTKSLA